MMKEYGLHWKDANQADRQAFADKVRDVNEFLDELGLVPPQGQIDVLATYHDACHLGHAQKVVDPPRRLLSQIPGLRLVDLPETEICCGSAGTYNLNQPDMARQLGDRKLDNILSTGAQIALASNAGCLLQIMREVREHNAPVTVMHPMDLLDLSYRNEQPKVGDVWIIRRCSLICGGPWLTRSQRLQATGCFHAKDTACNRHAQRGLLCATSGCRCLIYRDGKLLSATLEGDPDWDWSCRISSREEGPYIAFPLTARL